jgi:hypothetical protein
VADAGERREGPDRVTLVAFGLFVVLAGGNVIAVRYVSCEACELDPFWAAATRFLLGSLILAVIALVLRTGMPRGRALFGAVLYGVLGSARRSRSPTGGCSAFPEGSEPSSSRRFPCSRSCSRSRTGRNGSGGAA